MSFAEDVGEFFLGENPEVACLAFSQEIGP